MQKLVHPTTKIRTVKKISKSVSLKKNLPKKLSVRLLGHTIGKTKDNEPLEGQCGGQEA